MSKWLPIIIGGGELKKGLIVGHQNLCIVWLKRRFKPCESFTKDDIDKVDAVLHFTSRECVKMTIDCLQMMYDKWEN
jgi:hypothetical protein